MYRAADLVLMVPAMLEATEKVMKQADVTPAPHGISGRRRDYLHAAAMRFVALVDTVAAVGGAKLVRRVIGYAKKP
jgi:hypothetical protein